MNNPLYIYSILLEDNYYFIHHTEKKSYDQVLLEFEIYYDYVKKHKPIRILNAIPEKDELHLDSIVKEYMYMYGYAYVRGGSYSNIDLSINEESFILRELTEKVRNDSIRYSISYNHLLKNYINREWKSLEEIEMECNKLKKEYDQYQQEKIRRDDLQSYSKKKTITICTIDEIEKLHDFCKIRGKDYTQVTKEYLDLYEKVLPKLKHIIEKYMELCESPCEKYAKYTNKFPHFFMDPFFYRYSFSPSPSVLTDISEIDLFFEAILYFTNWIICRIQEYSFDITTYTYDIEWLYPRIFYVLEKPNLQRFAIY